MFEDNWYMFLLIIFLIFASDGNMSNREIAVMGAVLFALTMTANCPSEQTDDCFCNRNAGA